VTFVTVLVRQGHPGPRARPYYTSRQKARDASAHQHEDHIPWPVLVDAVNGRVHRLYGGLADPTFLLDLDGRVAFSQAITHAPTLHTALRALEARAGRGVVLGGIDRRPHVLPVIAGGWPALQRGAPQSIIDLETALPTAALLPWLGQWLRPVLRPIALRDTPLPWSARAALAGVVVAGAAVALKTVRPSTRQNA